MAENDEQFSFAISLSVLNHLGRNLYRNFITVLGEAISNAWDANAENVWISIDKENNALVVKDDGDGMSSNDFQKKFLKIGYSKRKDGVMTTSKGRPFIGRKGIGKLALLSCAKKISILTKTKDTEYVGGVIDNSGLNQAITDDLTPGEYQLGEIDRKVFEKFTKGHNQGTIIYFDGMNEGIKNSVDYLKKLIALYFRFSLLDNSFNIYVNEQPVTFDNLDDFAKNTQFAWNINNINDPYLTKLINMKAQSPDEKTTFYKLTPIKIKKSSIKGFIATVKRPSQLKIAGTEEKVTLDLLVNGRLREKDLLKQIPSTRIVESYIYGQIHFDELDDETDRFASSREGIVANDPKYAAFLKELKSLVATVMAEWDVLRGEIREDGDPDNPRLTSKERTSTGLFNVVAQEYSPPPGTANKDKVDGWLNELSKDAIFNFPSYAECFISENLIRKFIEDKNIPLTPEAQKEIDKWKTAEVDAKNRGNISIDIRRLGVDSTYLSMGHLANLVDKAKDALQTAALSRDATEYKPMRDAIAHTSLLTDAAKIKLTSVHENIKARIRTLLAGQP